MDVQPLRDVSKQILDLISKQGEPNLSPDELSVSSRCGSGPARASTLASLFSPIKQNWEKAKIALAIADRGAVIAIIQSGFDAVDAEIEKLWSAKSQEETTYGNTFALHAMGKLVMLLREISTGIERNQSDKHVPPLLYPADHYNAVKGIPAERLEAARRDGRLRGEKRRGRWYYSMADVARLWPEDFAQDPDPRKPA